MAKAKDVVLVGARSESGSWPVLREREETLEVGELRELQEGKPISNHGSTELVKLSRRPEHARLFDVETIAALPGRPSARNGPAQVANEAYREGWELVFGDRASEPN